MPNVKGPRYSPALSNMRAAQQPARPMRPAAQAQHSTTQHCCNVASYLACSHADKTAQNLKGIGRQSSSHATVVQLTANQQFSSPGFRHKLSQKQSRLRALLARLQLTTMARPRVTSLVLSAGSMLTTEVADLACSLAPGDGLSSSELCNTAVQQEPSQCVGRSQQMLAQCRRPDNSASRPTATATAAVLAVENIGAATMLKVLAVSSCPLTSSIGPMLMAKPLRSVVPAPAFRQQQQQARSSSANTHKCFVPWHAAGHAPAPCMLLSLLSRLSRHMLSCKLPWGNRQYGSAGLGREYYSLPVGQACDRQALSQ